MKHMIQDKLGIPSLMQKLKYENELPEDGKTVAEYRIQGTIYLILNLRGGGNSSGPNSGGMRILVRRQNGAGVLILSFLWRLKDLIRYRR
uniref:Ubiquitin-like domain-containing protein n=1 Tax=Nelumbo nucifera TaxID=4432 RepID=A0A822ZP98_NELNU|nr:TPA_asm: hypothetical protein HUJ06_004520 [Nelumbo nucifera]